MSLTLSRPTRDRGATSFSLSPIAVLAVLAMLALVACTLLDPEQSLAFAIALLVVLIAVADLRTGFLAFIALYPFIPITWGVDVAAWMPYLTAKRLCCMGLVLVFLPQCRKAWDTARIKRIAWLILTLVSVQTLAGVLSRDALGAIKHTFGDVVEMYLPFLIAAHLFRTKAQVRTLLTLVLISMGVVAVLGIVEHAIDYNFYDNFVAARIDIQNFLQYSTETYRHGDLHARRVRVAFGHPIEMGLHLMCVFLMLFYFLRQRGYVRRTILLAILPVLALGLLYTYSRGPLLGMVVGLVWLGLVGREVRVLLPVVVVCCLAGYFFMPSASRNVLQQSIVSSTDIASGDSVGGGSVRARLNLLQIGLEVSRANIWFGVGPNEVRQHKVNYGGGTKIQFTSVDNYYLQTLLWHGALVLALTVVLYLYLLGIFTRSALRQADGEIALLSALAASICIANYVALFTVGFNITLFWILLGPALRLCDVPETVRPLRRKRWRGLQIGPRYTSRRMRADRLVFEPAMPVPAAAGAADEADLRTVASFGSGR